MAPILRWETNTDCVTFRSEPFHRVEDWARSRIQTPSHTPVRLGPLLQLLDDGRLDVSDGVLRVPHGEVARLTQSELLGLGLPPICPHALVVESGHQAITQADFSFAIGFRASNGRRVEPESTVGCVALFGGQHYVLHEPQFSIFLAARAFNDAGREQGEQEALEQVNQRLVQIGRLQDLLGSGDGPASIDPYLQNFRVVVPTRFTLALSKSDSDGVHIDPELLVTGASEAPGASPTTRAIPTVAQRSFAERFARYDKVRPTYSLRDGWYVALPRTVQSGLAVVRDVQKADQATRRRFASNPRRFLQERLANELSEEAIEAVFFDDDYGERVSGVGLWEPRVLPWLKPATHSWLPPEECGLQIGDRYIHVPPESVPATLKLVEEAIAAGEPEVFVLGCAIPATEDTLSALRVLAEHSAGVDSRGAESAVPPGESTDKVVLLIKDNLEADLFTPASHTRPGDKTRPAALVSTLLSHQLVALEWLQGHWMSGSSGGLLADDMGLGKTFETLAFMCWLREQMTTGRWARHPILVVAPTGLLQNWRAEVAKHVTEGAIGDILLCWGAKLASLKKLPGRDVQGGLPVLDVESLRSSDMVLTTYETLRDYQHSFCRVNWSLAVFDEAQKIKNPQAMVTSAAKAVASKAELALALTGTPVENRLTDLWCIVDAVQPMRLGSLREFYNRYEADTPEAVERRQELGKLLSTQAGPQPAPMLRRLKKDHLPGLPRVTVHRHEALMPEAQANEYARAVANAKGAGGQAAMLRAIHEMRSISLHPFPESNEAGDAFAAQSARTRRLLEILDDVRQKGEKALVFLESKVVQRVLIDLLRDRYDMPNSPFVINGEVPGDRRKARVQEFQDRLGFDVMLLSPKAGGVGLTLTAANHVIHLARWWNPAVEDQCTDRVNRIGQTRDVHVHLPIARHPVYGEQSFDLLLDELLTRKRARSEDTLAPTEASDSELSALFEGATR